MTLVVQTLVDQIFCVMRDRIVTGKLPQNVPLRQDVLAAEFGVSKIPLREAFVRLKQEGLLVSKANHSFFVRPMSGSEVEEVYELRLKLEPDAVGRAAGLANEADRVGARQALEALEFAAGKSVFEISRLNRIFHMSLVHPAQKPLVIQVLERLNIIAERYISRHLEMPGQQERATLEHAHILKAWLAGRGDEAADLTRSHISATFEDLRKQLFA